MSIISTARAFANNEVAFVAWAIQRKIEGCLGFEITRIYPATGERTVLPAWVPFKGQSNPDWKPQTTSVWPIQKLLWRDLTARKRRDSVARRPGDVRVKYQVRALVNRNPDLEPVKDLPPKAYKGDPLLLSYFDEGVESNETMITSNCGDITATFTNGILSAQWLRHALEERGESLSIKTVTDHIKKPNDAIREYLNGDVLGTLKMLIQRASTTPGAAVHMALYELSDKELVELLLENKKLIHVILSNSGKGKDGAWDETDHDARDKLKKAGVDLQSRMFNNNHIGHNKFAVLVEGFKPKAVMTGSTNWTATGLCGQSNNAIIVESSALASDYFAYWRGLQEDTKSFVPKNGSTKSSTNKQGPDLRHENAKTPDAHTLNDKTSVTAWYSPNTEQSTKKDVPPPDLSALFSKMRKAKRVILFACFLPSRSGKTSIIEEAIKIGQKDHSLLVYGSVSDPTAMPNYVAPERPTGKTKKSTKTPPKPKAPSPSVFDKGNIHVACASALGAKDLVGDFEAEMLKVGHAIIHDKIVVVDPLSDDGFVAMGSHNLGYKASYENDENLLIIENNPKLLEAYAVHVLDVYEHYRFRAAQAQTQSAKDTEDGKLQGFLSVDDKWLDRYWGSGRGQLARYMCGI